MTPRQELFDTILALGIGLVVLACIPASIELRHLLEWVFQ